jgi:geranylgeranyl diphosphate synthase type I
LLSAIQRDLERRLTAFLDARLVEARRMGREVGETVEAVRDLCLRGGKRSRPALLIAGYRAADAQADLGPALDAGVALELLHAYFLIHDDWMDQDDVRRGAPSVHVMLARRHGSPEIGAQSAVLAGDYAAALALDALTRVRMPEKAVAGVVRCFARMQIDAVAGQQLDVLQAKNVEQTYVLKTASYTVRGPLVLGALLAGGSKGLLDALERFAMPIGVAFQMRDDLLGVTGDPRKTGKPLGSDLIQGKRTLLVEAARRRTRGRDRRVLESVLGNRKATQTDVKRAIEVLTRSGAVNQVESQIETKVTEALAALASARLTRQGRELLSGAVWTLANRQN